MSSPFALLLLFTFLTSFPIFSQSIVPPSRTFKYVNDFTGDYTIEYAADYRPTNIFTFPFSLCFYGTTPNAFILGLGMGHYRSEALIRVVWDANRGRPVGEGATLTFGPNGNLVLADADGSIAWQTYTANKGVVGINLLPNGNLVLYDKRGNYVWQSFDYPTDTLLLGQALRAHGGPTQLVSRMSQTDPSNGPYSFVMEQRDWAMYYQSPNSTKPLMYYNSGEFVNNEGNLEFLSFYHDPKSNSLGFRYNLTGSSSFGTSILSQPSYNSTYTILRVDIDGNLRMHTFNPNEDAVTWVVSFVLFDRNDGRASECQLPRRCGSLGVCNGDQCVACPTPQGLQGWSKACQTPALPPCKGGANVDYYKVEGVEHYTNGYDEGYTSEYNEGSGPMSLAQCRDICNKDCKCLGFFYRAESSKCLVVQDLGTLVKVPNTSHAAYIKISK